MTPDFIGEFLIRKRQKSSENGWQHQKRLAVRLAETLRAAAGIGQLDGPFGDSVHDRGPIRLPLDCDSRAPLQ